MYVGTCLAVLDTSVINVVLPEIAGSFPGDDFRWVITGYLLCVGLVQPLAAWLADRHGKARIFTVSLGLFTLGSLASGVAPSMAVLVGSRCLQGLGGGALVPLGMAIVYDTLPPERRGAGLGRWGLVAMAAPAVGPVLGGLLATELGWRWIFFTNVPIGVAATVVAARVLSGHEARHVRHFDAVGLALLSLGLGGGLFAIGQVGGWGWRSIRTVASLGVCVLLLGAFVGWALHRKEPIVDVRIFGQRTFALAMGLSAAVTTVQYAILVFLPLSLQSLGGLSPTETGVLLMPMAGAAAVSFAIGGRLTDRRGPRFPVALGGVCLAVATFLLAGLPSPPTRLTVVAAVVAQGVGFGFAAMPCIVAGLNALPARYLTQAASVRQLVARVASSIGIAALATLVVGEVEEGTAGLSFDRVFVVAGVIAVVAAIGGLMLPRQASSHVVPTSPEGL